MHIYHDMIVSEIIHIFTLLTQALLSTESHIGSTINELITSVSEEYQQRMELMEGVVSPFLASWQQFTTYTSGIYNQMYEANEFYIRDCVAFLQTYYETIRQVISLYRNVFITFISLA